MNSVVPRQGAQSDPEDLNVPKTVQQTNNFNLVPVSHVQCESGWDYQIESHIFEFSKFQICGRILLQQNTEIIVKLLTLFRLVVGLGIHY